MRTLLSALLASGSLLAAAQFAPAQDTKPDPKQIVENAKKQAEEAAMKAQMEKAIKDAADKATGIGQPPMPPPVNPNAVPVPDALPVLKTIPLEDGLVAEELKIGDGYEVKPGGAVVAHYHGTLKEGGKVFDSSFNRGEPAMFTLGQVIPGWQKGVPGMKIGGIRRLIIPAKLAYADRSPSQDIPANSDLVFIIQLIDALQVNDDKVGDGEEVGSQAVSVTAYSMKDADGKEIGSSTKEKPYIWVPNELMGVSAGLEGMKVGGKRTIKVPAKMNQSHPQLAGDRPQNVAVTVVIELLAVRNLAPAQPKK